MDHNSGKSKGTWWDHIWRDYHRNNAWPDPFIPMDRAAVKVPFQMMANNGWERQNLLADYHFTEENDALSPGGAQRLNWIATQAPTPRRMVFVQRGQTPAITAARIGAVQASLSRITPNGPLPRIAESNFDSQGYAGDEADAVINGAGKSRPDPHIPNASPQAISNYASATSASSFDRRRPSVATLRRTRAAPALRLLASGAGGAVNIWIAGLVRTGSINS